MLLNVIIPAVLKITSSPVAGTVPPQFEAKVQSFSVPVPPAQVTVAAKPLNPLPKSSMNIKRLKQKFFCETLEISN